MRDQGDEGCRERNLTRVLLCGAMEATGNGECLLVCDCGCADARDRRHAVGRAICARVVTRAREGAAACHCQGRDAFSCRMWRLYATRHTDARDA